MFKRLINIVALVCLYSALPLISWAQLYPASSTAVGITASKCPNWAATKTNTSGRTISSAGTISYEEITGQLNINSSGVTLTCVKINANDNLYGINCTTTNKCNGTIVQDSEIHNCDSACILSQSPSEGGRAIFRRLYIHDTQNDLVKLKSYTTLEDSYLADFNPPPGAHNDAIQLVDGQAVTIQRNNIQGPYKAQTSAIIAKSDSGAIDHLMVKDNYLSGGAYTLYLLDGGSGSPTNTTVTGNTWNNNSWQFGPVDSDISGGDCLVWSNNQTTTSTPVSSGSPVSCSCP